MRYSNQLCDSLRFLLDLVVDSFTEVNEVMNVCQDALPVLWQGQVLTSEGLYFDTTYSPSGCDLVRSRLDFSIDSIISMIRHLRLSVLWIRLILGAISNYQVLEGIATHCVMLRDATAFVMFV